MTTIFIVDDVPENIDIVLQHLKQFGYELAIAENGASAIERLKHITPDLILLDVMMPGIDGFQVCRHVQSQPETKDIPIIFMTALDDTASKIRGFEVGGVDYITKPIELVELLARLQTHLALRQLQVDLKNKVQELTQALEEKISQLNKCQTERDELYEQLHQKQVKVTEQINSAENVSQLSKREIEVLQLIVAGKTSQEIARKFHLSDSTVRTYRQRIMQKLQVNSLLELIEFVLDNQSNFQF
ncbi:response regulator transcription factor [Anaerolineales bacterium HSG24]|nr:response regulator transcription factor [Anaerolineales bacterium HSG24]